MNWILKGLLLATGGLIGCALANTLFEENSNDCEDALGEHDEKTDGMEMIIEKIRQEAMNAIAECETEAEREEVYTQIRASVEKMKDELQKKSDAIIAELKEETNLSNNPESRKVSANAHVQNIRDTLEKFSESLDETLESLKPQEA